MSATWCTTLVFDILGTLVDETGSLRAAIAAAAPSSPELIDELLGIWQGHVADQQEAVRTGRRPYASSTVLDREAATAVAERAGITSAATIDELSAAGRRLDPWPDTIEGLGRLAERYTLIGLSNASRADLTGLDRHTGMRWHQLLSGEAAGSYKPDPEVYALALAATHEPPNHMLMVAAHAWDLRAAAATGMRTAYVDRPNGDPPREDDTFDLTAPSLVDLADILLGDDE
jgi:2-haloacid dehalogenase